MLRDAKDYFLVPGRTKQHTISKRGVFRRVREGKGWGIREVALHSPGEHCETIKHFSQ